MDCLIAKDLMNDVAAAIPAKWRAVGTQLNVSSSDLDRIGVENPQDCQGSFQKMLDHWKKKSTSPYTWRTIIDALKAPAVGEVARANNLETKYISNISEATKQGTSTVQKRPRSMEMQLGTNIGDNHGTIARQQLLLDRSFQAPHTCTGVRPKPSTFKLTGNPNIEAMDENASHPPLAPWQIELRKRKKTMLPPIPASSLTSSTGPSNLSIAIPKPCPGPLQTGILPKHIINKPKPPGEDQKGEQALHEQLEAKLSLMAAQLSEAQQKLNEEKKLSGQYKAERDQYEKDLGHTREELGEVRKELGEVRKELADLKKEHPTCKTFWIAERHNVTQLQKPLGGGAWGYVVEGQFRGQQVAVKCIHENYITEQHTIKRVYREICTMAQMCHPNLVQFIAAVMDDQGGPMIITELLDTTLRKAYMDSLLNMAQCVDILCDVASALSYLHELETPIIHRDVSSNNVLLKGVTSDRCIAKLADFGSANWVKLASTMGEGTIIYTAPEAYPPHPTQRPKAPAPQTTKIDVYSYGVLMCEVTLGEFPDHKHLREMKEKMKTKHVFLHTLVMKCTQEKPDKRPTMDVVLRELKSIKK